MSLSSEHARRDVGRRVSPAVVAAIVCVAACILPAQSAVRDDSPLAKGFRDPPASTRPWAYWYWASDDVTREGITRDLEAMARVGIGEALLGTLDVLDVARGKAKILSEDWWSLVEHAIREGARLGVDIGIFNGPGWSLASGPWVTPGRSMRYLDARNDWTLGPDPGYQARAPDLEDGAEVVAVVAVPAPLPWRRDRRAAALSRPLPEGDETAPITIDLEADEPFTACSLVLHPSTPSFAADGTLAAADASGRFRTVRSFTVDRIDRLPPVTATNTGPMRKSPVAIAFPATTSRRFRVVMTGSRGKVGSGEVELSSAPTVEAYVEKQLGVMHMTPNPPWDAYAWPAQAEPDAPDMVVDPAKAVDLTSRLDARGNLRWDVPDGAWIVTWVVLRPTGALSVPYAEDRRYSEVDKMSRAAVQAHFDSWVGKLLARISAADRGALKHVLVDSWEAGPQNWSKGSFEAFKSRFGYDPVPWMPVLTGKIVGSAQRSDRFLWDLRRLAADRVATEFAGTLRDLAHRSGLLLWLQNYGHWGFPGEFLQYGGQADVISGEFWAGGELGRVELRAAASAAHVYGKKVVSAEAFTGGPAFSSTPASLKRSANLAMAEGANHFALNAFYHQPDERLPGTSPAFTTNLNRHNTWFEAARSWIDWLRSSHFLLQQGRHAADVLVFIGEDVPKMTGPPEPRVPPGYDFDWINAEVIERHLRVEGGRFVLPDGATYRILALPPSETMRPALLRKIIELVEAGGAVFGSPPSRSPSLADWPACDERVRELASKLWTRRDEKADARAQVGRGHVFEKGSLAEALAALQVQPDVDGLGSPDILWTHRTAGDVEIWFLANQGTAAVSLAPSFRVAGKAPEIWDPVRRTIARTAAWETIAGDRTRVSLELDSGESTFLVFREPATAKVPVMSVSRNGRPVISTASRPSDSQSGSILMRAANDFTIAAWVRPRAEVALPAETAAGMLADSVRNDVVFPLHGGVLFGNTEHTTAGVSAGTNGVVVFEHGTGLFSPVLVHRGAISDWTQVVVAYEGGRPTLYLDGTPVRRGLPTGRTVHPSPTPKADDPTFRSMVDGGLLSIGGTFQGELGQIWRFPRTLSEADVSRLARIPPATHSATVTFGAENRLELEAFAPGRYEVETAEGNRTIIIGADALPGPLELTGPWDVRFPPGRDAPERISFESLSSWPTHPDPGIRYFSGTASYTRAFELSGAWSPAALPGSRMLLDLGDVASLAEVIVNGTSLGVLWCPPYVVDVTDGIRPGSNVLELRVTNSWLNRMIGAKRFPDGLPGSPEPRFKPAVSKDVARVLEDRLAPAGLLGPVRILVSVRVPIR